jgi:hypothetical protein
MSISNKNIDLISRMVDETFRNVEEEEQTSFDNVLSFQKTSESEQLQFEYNSFLGAYDIERSCYVFQINDQLIELPKNWGPFKLVNPNQVENGNVFSLSRFEDSDFLIDVLADISGLKLEEIICKFDETHFKLVLSEDPVVAAPIQMAA